VASAVVASAGDPRRLRLAKTGVTADVTGARGCYRCRRGYLPPPHMGRCPARVTGSCGGSGSPPYEPSWACGESPRLPAGPAAASGTRPRRGYPMGKLVAPIPHRVCL